MDLSLAKETTMNPNIDINPYIFIQLEKLASKYTV